LNPDDRETKENLRFVRKLMEQQQNPPSRQEEGQGEESPDDSSQSGSRQAGQQNGTEGKERPKEQQKGNPPEEETPGAPRSPEYGDQMADGQQPRPDQKEKEPEKREAEPRSATVSAPPPDNGARSGAERVLNRLKDQPGKALMIPPDGYGRRKVEKDW
jgi:Ca-activated chloride channel family protein